MSNEIQDVIPDATQQQPQPVHDADAESQAAEVETGDTPAESSTEKKENGIQKRIDELTKYWRNTERDRDYWREQALQAQKKPEDPAIPDQPHVAKTLADFEYDESKYQSYLIAEASKNAVQSAKQLLKQEQEITLRQQKQSEFANRESGHAKEIEDYFEVTRNPSLAINQTMAEVAAEMDDGPAVLYYLGKNPVIAEKISQLPPLAAARELGKIEAKLATTKGQAVSKAPPPTPKIEAKGTPTTIDPASPDSDKLSSAEWLRRRNKQITKK